MRLFYAVLETWIMYLYQLAELTDEVSEEFKGKDNASKRIILFKV